MLLKITFQPGVNVAEMCRDVVSYAVTVRYEVVFLQVSHDLKIRGEEYVAETRDHNQGVRPEV